MGKYNYKVKTMIKTSRPSYIGHRQRIKDKYKKSGIDGWLDYEILELVLSYAVARKDTKPIAKGLMDSSRRGISVNPILPSMMSVELFVVCQTK